MTGNKLSLPLANGGYPFRLSDEERSLSYDEWAWLFLRLNPRYRHDYLLWRDREEKWSHVGGFRPGKLVRSFSEAIMGPPDLRMSVDIEIMDSRYFTADGAPLPVDYRDGALERTLREVLDETGWGDIYPFIVVREFDAAREYGISAWIDPNERSLPKFESLKVGRETQRSLENLPWRPSWFFHLNEPVWQTGTSVLREAQAVACSTGDGQRAQVGLAAAAVAVSSVEAAPLLGHGLDHVLEKNWKLVKGMPIPLRAREELLTNTQFQFLVCLEGYVDPQVDMAFKVAAIFRDLHREYDPAAVKKGAVCKPVEVRTEGSLLGRLERGPVCARVRSHWRVVTIDVAAYPGKQKSAVKKKLDQEKRAIKDELAFPPRERKRDIDSPDHWLKKSLCALELYLYDEDLKGSAPRISEAIHWEDSPAYFEIRQLNVPDEITNAGRPKMDDRREALARQIEKAIENGLLFAQSWYEFLASLQFIDPVSTTKLRIRKRRG